MSKKILIIDDDTGVCVTLKALFTEAGYDVNAATDAYAGMAAAVSFKPDLIILDMQMPAGGGQGVQERLSQNTFTNTTPIIFSSSLNKAEVEKILPAGALVNGYVQKPPDLEALIAKVESIIGKP